MMAIPGFSYTFYFYLIYIKTNLQKTSNLGIMKTITCDDLIEKLRVGHATFRLLNALEPSAAMTAQIPHSLNIIKEEEILLLLKKDEEIVVYCTDHICNKSIVMYYQLEGLGYKNVFRYPGGIREWVSIGQELEDISA